MIWAPYAHQIGTATPESGPADITGSQQLRSLRPGREPQLKLAYRHKRKYMLVPCLLICGHPARFRASAGAVGGNLERTLARPLIFSYVFLFHPRTFRGMKSDFSRSGHWRCVTVFRLRLAACRKIHSRFHITMMLP